LWKWLSYWKHWIYSMQSLSKYQWHFSLRKKVDLSVHIEAQKTWNNQRNSETKDQCWMYHSIWLQAILQCHSNKTSIVLAQKQTWRPME
jgi:hypothetical protein